MFYLHLSEGARAPKNFFLVTHFSWRTFFGAWCNGFARSFYSQVSGSIPLCLSFFIENKRKKENGIKCK